MGIFGLIVLVIYLQKITGGFSLIAGIICLAILVIPVIERSMESAIDTVDPELEDGDYALGATKWQTIKMTTLPAAINGIMTSIILGFGRAAEESSVVVLTVGYSQFLPALGIVHNSKFLSGLQIHPFNDVTASLPYAVYNAYENSNVIPMSNAYAIAFVLITFVLLINITAKVVCSRAVGGSHGSKGDFTQSIYRFITDPFGKKRSLDKPSYVDEEMTSLTLPVVSSGREGAYNPEITTVEPLPDRQPSDGAKSTVPVQPVAEPPKTIQPRIKILLEGTGIARLFRALSKKIDSGEHVNKEKNTPTDVARVQHIADLSAAAAVRREQPFPLAKIMKLSSVPSYSRLPHSS